MQPEQPIATPPSAAAQEKPSFTLPTVWQKPLIRLAGVWLAILAVTFGDWATMADQWWNISTYNHVLFVPLIVGWLVYIRHEGLLFIVPDIWWPALLLVAGAMGMWLIGSIAGVNTVSQLGAVLAMIASVIAVLGRRVALACAFPLGYLLFLVPFGDEMVPALQMITAKLVIWMTEASGIPAIIDGVFIDTPGGLFEVAEACSGVKFLVAMLALGVLVAYTCFRSWKRRIAFLTASLALPIVANGVRAWGTIYIAQFAGLEFAEGFDHVFYGWVFFALVVVALLAFFWRYFDRDPDDLGIDFPHWIGTYRTAPAVQKVALYTVALLAIVAVFAVWRFAAGSVEAELPDRSGLPEVAGWQSVIQMAEPAWDPRMTGADRKLVGRYEDARGRSVDVVLGIYAGQEEGREAGAFGEGALVPDTAWRWLAPWPSDPTATGDILFANGQVKRHARTSYRNGDILTGSAARLKLDTLFDRLLLDGQPTITLILSTAGQDDAAAAATLADFERATGDRGEWMDHAAGLR